jgi:tetratricopeptide (TPR) repeat protein
MRCANASLVLFFSGASFMLASSPPAQVTQTESILREEVRLQPASFRTNHALGEFYIQNHNLKAAISYLEKARQIDPAHYENAYDLALAYLQTGMTAQSREVIAALLAQKDRAELHNLLGDVEEREGHVDAAVKQYETAARMDPTEKNLFDLGSDLLRHRGFKPALKVFVFATGRYPQSAKLRVGLGIAYYSLGQYDDAVATLCQAVDLDRVRAVRRPQPREAGSFLEICDARYQTRSTLLTSQLPVASWHAQIGDPTIADSILDRLVHNAHRIDLQGESMRKKRRGKTNGDAS